MTRLIRDYCPEQVQLPLALWRREALAQLIEQQCGLSLEGTTVGRYLHRWGRSPQKPTAPAREQCPYQVQQW
ncbi:MAG: hypothetical protein BRC50_14395 [Cyanobacteria bacterium SW_11_48_12]|nr:MAG: hypothetical protein BRC45_10050 [Cyanobacteria bacterium QS_5_48_63]PSO88527.1 MAG: hypothetical protein BRC43_06590 [Cyanobacteria bacterium QS_3_48_167]PSP10569.1 MAG: hypothetical protein BRC50_14395 [Cyanobacteria bacterium SW_11_48_12]